MPVRTLCQAHDAYWAGADQGGVWRSADGVDWKRAGLGLEHTPVYALAPADDRLIAGTEQGVALGDGVGSAFSEKYGGRALEEIVRDTLYRFSQGMKVAVECVLMAADAGLLDMDGEVIAVAGTGDGADTAIVCKPAYPRTFHTLEIREVLAKPRIP